MHWRKIVLFSLVVAALGWLALRSTDDPRREAERQLEERLLPGLERSRVHALILERAEYGDALRFERDADGRWWMVEPLAWRADRALLDNLLDVGTSSTGMLEFEVAAADAGLEPPAYELVFIERAGDGGERRHRIEVGGADLAQQRLFVRAGQVGSERLMRTTRAIEGVLERPPDEFRDRMLTQAHHSEVRSFVRRGQIALPPRERIDAHSPEADFANPGDPAAPSELGPDGRIEIGLSARPRTGEWWVEDPLVARLDPSAMGLVLRALTQMRATAFLEDSQPDLALYGLDPPMFELEADLARGETLRFAYGVPETDLELPLRMRSWGLRSGEQDQVLGADSRDVLVLTRPLAYLLDYQPVRFVRDQIRALELELEGRVLRIERVLERWFLVETLASGEVLRPPAEESAVEELLTLLERSELLLFPFVDVSGRQRLPDPEPQVSGRVEFFLAGQRRAGFELGPLHESGANRGRLLRRFDEEAWGLLDEDVAARLHTDAEHYRPRVLFRLQEQHQSELRARRGAHSQRWLRDGDSGQWRRSGRTDQDLSFAVVVDALLNPRVRRWLPAEALELPLEDEVEVEVTPRSGSPTRYSLGHLEWAGERWTVARQGDRLGVVPPVAHERLLEFLGP